MIGGNITANLLLKKTSTNEIGESISEWEEFFSINGFLDFTGGEANYGKNAKIEESTHLFICDYFDISAINLNEVSLSINDRRYDIVFIDNPMNLNDHIEIFLK